VEEKSIVSNFAKWMSKVALVGALGAGLAAVVVPDGPAEAQGLKAQVFLTQAKVPAKTSERGLLQFARKHRTLSLRETRDAKVTDRMWLARLVTAFNKPPNDLEFTVNFYNVEGGKQKFVDSMSIFTSDRSQKTYVSKLKLERPKFKPNEKHELVVLVRRREAGKARFNLVGERKRNTGEVSFGADET
jgi:hypothetical protein